MLFFAKIIAILSIATAIGCAVLSSSTPVTDLKELAPTSVPESPSAAKERQTAVFAGGCFWGVEAVFEHVKGVIDVRSGYAGGEAKTAEYETVSEGTTGHAESVKVTFDPAGAIPVANGQAVTHARFTAPGTYKLVATANDGALSRKTELTVTVRE